MWYGSLCEGVIVVCLSSPDSYRIENCEGKEMSDYEGLRLMIYVG